MLMATPETQPPELVELTELDQRRADGQLITLWWVKNTMHTYVEVVDLKTQPPSVTEIPVVPPAKAHEVFAHPFRYGAEGEKSN